jgi:hypothetical protein
MFLDLKWQFKRKGQYGKFQFISIMISLWLIVILGKWHISEKICALKISVFCMEMSVLGNSEN